MGRGGEIVARVGHDGSAVIPADALSGSHVQPGSTIRVRLVSDELPRRLRQRNVTEEEIESIIERQLEDRQNVVRFLMSEGALERDAGFLRRAGNIR
ncbi:MAG TPA: hypothetical protein VMH23_08350 [Bacteroidota bacterium]|nr:hypothetical protein [Bacteroidota bacterium]